MSLTPQGHAAVPTHCDTPMTLATTQDDARLGVVRFACKTCGADELSAPAHADDPPPPGEPTPHPAGSEEKILVMMARLARGEAIFHPQDGRELSPPAQASNRAVGRELPRGVKWNRRNRKYEATVRLRGRRHYLGLFDTPAEAARAVERARDQAGNSRAGGPDPPPL